MEGGVTPKGSQRELGCPKRRQQDLGCAQSLQGSITPGHFSALGLTPHFCYLPNLVRRRAPLICPFQCPWFVLPDKRGPSSCQVSLSQSLCK